MNVPTNERPLDQQPGTESAPQVDAPTEALAGESADDRQLASAPPLSAAWPPALEPAAPGPPRGSGGSPGFFRRRGRATAAAARSPRGKLAALAVGAYFVVQLMGLPGIGLTDDDDFYIPAGRTYAQWFSKAVKGPFTGDLSAWTRQGVAAAWTCGNCNREHPPLAKWAIGAGVHLLTDTLGVLPDYQSGRLGIVLLSTLLAYLLFRLAYDTYGGFAALFSVGALLTLPRFYFHSHAPTLDVAVAVTYFLAVYAFWRSRHSFGWGLFAGVAFGLALLTKLNAPFMLAPLGLYGLLRLRNVGLARGQLRFPAFNVALPAMAVLGPLLFLVLWPRLWFDTVKNLGDYIQFHLHHYGIYFYYLGTLYNDVFAPWHAPFVMTAVTTPIVTLGLGLAGIGVALRDTFARAARTAVFGSLDSERRDLALLTVLNAFTCIGVVAFSNIPKYGGVKLFLPFFPFFVLLAGAAFGRLCELLLKRLPRLALRPRLVQGVALGLCLTPGALDLYRAHPYHLSYYGPLVGGLRGAATAGFEIQYYDVLYLELADWLEAHYGPAVGQGAPAPNRPELRVFFLPNNKEYSRTFPYLHRAGRLSPSIRIVGALEQADVLVLTHERRWAEYPALFERHQGRPVLWELSVDRVPLLTVYKLK